MRDALPARDISTSVVWRGLGGGTDGKYVPVLVSSACQPLPGLLAGTAHTPPHARTSPDIEGIANGPPRLCLAAAGREGMPSTPKPAPLGRPCTPRPVSVAGGWLGSPRNPSRGPIRFSQAQGKAWCCFGSCKQTVKSGGGCAGWWYA